MPLAAAAVSREKVLRVSEAYARLRRDLALRIVDLEPVIEEVLICILAGGHALLLGVPGLAKTLLVSSIAELLDLSFSRIQFTPDLLPSDIAGTEILVQDADTRDRGFAFHRGPIFANLVLADEINRTPPKTQAALIEAMEERQVTSLGRRYEIPSPFFVLATQNPIEQEGTYPLPAAQLDRFLFNILLDYPSEEAEGRIARLITRSSPPPLSKAISQAELNECIDLVRRLPAPEKVLLYARDLARLSRPGEGSPGFVSDWISWGVGPRAAQALVLGAKARALLRGRDEPTLEDVDAVLHPAFRHRLIRTYAAEAENITTDGIIDRLRASLRASHS